MPLHFILKKNLPSFHVPAAPETWSKYTTSFIQGLVIQILSAHNLGVELKYSEDLNTGLVWYSNGQKLSDRQMVRYSNAI